MIKYLMVFILSLFQDNYVRIGSIIGGFSGFWTSEVLKVNQTTNIIIFVFIGWGLGVYIGSYFKTIEKSNKKKFSFIKGGKN